MSEKIKEKAPLAKERGYTRSIYISRSDTEFVQTLERYLKLREITFSDFIVRACKYVVLQDGSTHHKQFLDVYKEVVSERIHRTKVKYKGQAVNFEKVIEDIINDPDSRVKF